MKTPYWRYIDAIPKNLNKEEREWYKTFIKAYYYRSTKAMNELNMPINVRRDLYNRHRGVCRDIMNCEYMDEYKEEIHIEEFEITNIFKKD